MVVLVGGLAIAKILVMGLAHLPVPAIFVVTAGLANAYYMRRNASLNVAAWVLISIALLGFATASWNTGGFGGAVIFIAPIIPILTTLLIDSRAAWISLTIVCLILAALFALEINGLVPENPNSPDLIRSARLVVLACLCLTSTWVVWSFSSMTRSLLQKLDKQSNTDYLTGALNRRGIESALSLEIARARRTNSSISFIMADVDFFKAYNDSNGHQAGDKCLIDIVDIISSCCERSTDIVGRFGGEEFVLILPDTDSEGARSVADNVCAAMAERNIPYGPTDAKPVSLTLGVVSAPGSLINNIDQLISEADRALYQGKNQGRNCVVSKVILKQSS